MRVCKSCGRDKPDDQFRPQRWTCRACVIAAITPEDRERKQAAERARRAADPEKYRRKGIEYRNGPRRAQYLRIKKASYERRKAKIWEYERNRWKTDINWKLRNRLRWFLRMGIKGRKRSTRADELLGCPMESFKLYISSQFKPGMSWENYGEWHLDHIMPCAVFDLTKPEHQRVCFHFSNLRPMWAKDNLAKSDKPPAVHQFKLL